MVKRDATFKGFAEWARGHAKSVWATIFIPFWLKIYNDSHYLLDGNARPDFIVVDDLETEEINGNPKRQDGYAKWIERSLIPTMTGKYRRFLYSNNRWAKRMVQTVLQARHTKWKVHHVKAYDPKTLEPLAWPEMYPREYWEAQVRDLGTLACQAEYNQEPHVEGKIFLTKYFRYEKIPRIDHFDSVLGYWDPAYSDKDTADTNAIRIWGRKGDYYYLLKSFVRHCEMDDAIEWMHLYQATLPKGFTIRFYYERQFYNKTLEKTHQKIAKKWRKRGVVISLIRDDDRKGKKYDRIVSILLPLFQQGFMIFNKKEESSNDHQEGTAQLQGIEPGYNCHDDAPDADHGAITKLSNEYNPGSNNEDSGTTYGGGRRTSKY
jgi:phage terminase large subunit-like protein